MKILFLDDDPNRTKIFKNKVPFGITTETAEECIGAIKKEGSWDFVFLDHDLGGEVFVDSNREDTGMEVVRWIISNKPDITQVVIHSMNHPAAKRMKEDLREVGYDTEAIPFPLLGDLEIYDMLNRR